MQIPPTPNDIEHLDLMRLLSGYAAGNENWRVDDTPLSQEVKRACQTLHENLIRFTSVVERLLGDIGSKEMRTFTIHDRTHSLKVAHLMWHILAKDRRERITPPEIGLMVAAAYFHDLGMALDDEERALRLSWSSDLWDRLEIDENHKQAIDTLRSTIKAAETTDEDRLSAQRKLFQAEEALLCIDTRERHATHERYHELLEKLMAYHERDPENIPDTRSCLSFAGDSFLAPLIEICVSHNEDATELIAPSHGNLSPRRFPNNLPFASCDCDLQLIAASLRLADILDFDRERTPPILFYYLLPDIYNLEDRSVLEWAKHLTIASWFIRPDAIEFRGRCESHVIHHAIVQFAEIIETEIRLTRTTFERIGIDWPFMLPVNVDLQIHEEGYRYVPYRFELDEQRIYELFMGNAIYHTPFAAVRELIQNAVDACKLQDALIYLHDTSVKPSEDNRINIRYEEPTDTSPVPRLIVQDTGTGMDQSVIEKYFLKVAKSYYSSSDFNRIRVDLRKSDLDFSPVSEFGIGFLACFLLADEVRVETAMTSLISDDTLKRTLYITGRTRLIRLHEEPAGRFKGTRITLYLTRISDGDGTGRSVWQGIKTYIEEVCQELPYTLRLEHVSATGDRTVDSIEPCPLTVELPAHIEEMAIRIPVDDHEIGMKGEIVLINSLKLREHERHLAEEVSASVTDEVIDDSMRYFRHSNSVLLRGGFRIGGVPGLPESFSTLEYVRARIRLVNRGKQERGYIKPSLDRTTIQDQSIGEVIRATWLTHLLDHVDELPNGQVASLRVSEHDTNWQKTLCRIERDYDAWRLYSLARHEWHRRLINRGVSQQEILVWEHGEGKPIWINEPNLDSRLFFRLLEVVLPRVTDIIIHDQGVITAKPPVSDWRSILSNWNDYGSIPCKWKPCVEYGPSIQDYLYYEYPATPKKLNSRFEQVVYALSDDECEQLKHSLDRLISGRIRGKRVNLSATEANLLRCVQDLAGHAKIGYGSHQQWTLNSFVISEVP